MATRATAQGGLLPGGVAPRPSASAPTGALVQDTISKSRYPVIGSSDSLEISTIITGIVGGELRNGVIDVKLPAGAIDGTAQISIRVNSLDSKRCELSIVPASANQFAKPVLLTVDCSGLSHLERYGILWLDESTGEWVDIGSTVDLNLSTITAELSHFSQYKVAEVLREGKAGW